MITIDGAQGEGGGQVLRTSIGLSLFTGDAFRIQNIRANRKKPGLLRQHLTAVEAAVAISNGSADGAVIGSKELVFRPGKVKAGDYRFAVGTAGSATLVLQTILPVLILGTEKSRLTLEGGTHNPHAPPFEFLHRAFLPLLNRMGPRVVARLDRAGFYPAGGGRFEVEVQPAKRLERLDLLSRGETTSRSACAIISNLSLNIGDRELKVVSQKLGWARECLRVEEVPSRGPGNALILEVGSENLMEVFTGFGERGLSAEMLAETVVAQVRDYLAAEAAVGEHLADQLLIPMALAGGGSFRTVAPSRHTITNCDVISKFLPVRFDIEKGEKNHVVSLRS